jgi:hypothetical protein
MTNSKENIKSPPSLLTEFYSNTIEVNGIKINYLLAGDPDGSPVLLWHGFLGTSSSWKK